VSPPPAPHTVDLNSDLGEGFGPWRMGDDEALLDLVTTCNIACGLHAGDPVVMARTCAAAAARNVRIGAHPGHHDLYGFGRRTITGENPDDVASAVIYQVGALRAIAATRTCEVGHVKLHGALSNQAAVDPRLAETLARAIHALGGDLAWLVPAGSAMVAAGHAAGLRCVEEVFPDRGYAQDGSLLPRSQPGALFDDPEVVARRALAMVTRGGVPGPDGELLPLSVDSLCVHGDTPGAVAAAAAVRAALEAAGVTVAPF